MSYVDFQAFLIDGTPAPSGSAVPVWSSYYDVTTGATASAPAFQCISGSFYRFVDDPLGKSCGVVDLGAACSPRYVHYAPTVSGTFVAYNLSGDPDPSLSPAWISRYDVDTALTSSATISAVGSGIFKTSVSTSVHEAGLIDVGAASSQEYVVFDSLNYTGGGSGGPQPYATNFSPATGSVVYQFDPITFDVVDSAADKFNLLVIIARFETYEEVVHDGVNFGQMYQNVVNTVTAISSGLRFTILRDGGWLKSPTIVPYASD